MKQFLLILISTLLLFSFNGNESKKIIGHWVSDIDLYDLKVNDTLIFAKTKYTDKLYQWAGALAGIELTTDNNFYEYHNVMCSDESSPLRYCDEKWILNNNIISISSPEREMDWKIVSANNKKLMIVVSTINSK